MRSAVLDWNWTVGHPVVGTGFCIGSISGHESDCSPGETHSNRESRVSRPLRTPRARRAARKGDSVSDVADADRDELREEFTRGDRQNTISVGDGPLTTFVVSLENNANRETVGMALQQELDEDIDTEALNCSEVLQFALRPSFREAAPECLDAAGEAVRDHNRPDL